MRKIDRFIQYLDYKGITENKATQDCGLAQGLLHQAKSGKSDLGAKSVEKILIVYQDLDKDWLLTGNGEMLKDPTVFNRTGANSTNISRSYNHVNNSDTLNKAMDEIAEQRQLVKKSQEQIDRLISIIEKMQCSTK